MSQLYFLMLLASGAMMGMAGSFSILSHALDRRAAERKYLMRTMGQAKTAPAAAPRRALAQPEQRVTAAGRLAGLVNYNAQTPEMYKMAWWVVLVVCLVPARIGTWLVAILLGGWAWAAFPLLFLLCARGYFGGAAGAFRQKLFRQFPDALDLIVRAVRVGVPVAEGIRTAARETEQPTAAIFQRLADELTIGVSLEDALRSVTKRYDMQEYRFFATALALQSQTGGGLSETLEGLAETIRKRVAARERAKAMAAEAKLSSIVLAVLPLAVVGLLMLVSPGYLAPLITNPNGKYVLLLAVTLEGLGMLSMKYCIQKALS